jgi:hypothetical protein
VISGLFVKVTVCQKMKAKRLPKSIRKFIRKEKSRLRREKRDRAEAEKEIAELARGFRKRYSRKKSSSMLQ